MTDNYQTTVIFAELARSAVDLYLGQLNEKLKSPADDFPVQVSCIDSIRKLLNEDLRPAFIQDLAERLQYGSNVRTASTDALARFLTLLERQLHYIEGAERQAGASPDERGTTPSCFEQCLQSARDLSERFPENFQDIVAVEARRLAGVSLVPPPSTPAGNLFSGAPHDSLWPTQRRARIVDEHSVSAPTYRWGSRGGR